MILKFIENYKSIDHFNSINLNDLTVLTGVNGSGKTQLLESIKAGHSQIDDIEVDEIVYFDYHTFFVENEKEFNNQQIIQEKRSAWQRLDQRLNNIVIRQQVQSLKQQLGNDYNNILKVTANKPLLKLEKSDFNGNQVLYDRYQNYKKQIYDIFSHKNLKGQPEIYGIRMVAESAFVSLDELSERDFKDLYKPVNLKNSFLPIQLSKVFLDYKCKEYNELVIKKAEAVHYGDEIKIESAEDFVERYGPKPWEVIEKILAKFESFDYTINNPDDMKIKHDTQSRFTLTLKNKRKGVSIELGDLSSGEKVLFALVLSIYKSLGDDIFPRLILLDEIDASLHPSMIKNLLDVINDVFVSEHNVKVILASHSATTIAFAEEEWIYVANKEGSDRFEKQQKKEAFKILSEGFITLEEGLQIFDQFSKKELAIFTEGNNISFIEKAINLFTPELEGLIEVVTYIKDKSGEKQLGLLFDFFTRMPHENKVLFVYDCDCKATTKFTEKNKTYGFIFEKNVENAKVSKGIENLFPIECFKPEFYPTRNKSDGGTQRSLNKPKFERFIIDGASQESFMKFKPLINKIKCILGRNDEV